MGLRAFRGKPFEHTHENKAFDALFELLDVHCTATGQEWLLLGNFYVGSRELDAMVVKSNAVIIIDFKDFSGQLRFSEDGPWYIEDAEGECSVEVKGGSSPNPLVQLRRNKSSVMDFLGRGFADLNDRCNWGHTAALVTFQGAVVFDASQIPGSIKPWFYISDMERVVRDIEAIVSREIRFSSDEMGRFAALLGLSPFVPAGGLDTRKLDGYTEQGDQPERRLTTQQTQALASFHAWLKGGEGIFRLLGMASTGKRFLFPYLVNMLSQEGLEIDLLTPSSRLSGNYSHPDVEPVSIYTWLYEQNPDAFEERDNRKIAIYNIRKDIDLRGKIPVLVDAHLLSDTEFEIVDRRYGSGRLISDFLSLIAQHPFIIVGDPYQLPRGSLQRSLTADLTLAAGERKVVSHSLMEQILVQPEDALSTLQAHLVESLNKSRFNKLPRLTGPRLETIEKGSPRKWEPDTQNLIPESVCLCATHEQANKINGAVKTQLLGHASPIQLAPGDRIDFHSRTPILVSQDDSPIPGKIPWINAGVIGLVDEVFPDIETHFVELRGRKQATPLRFQRASCRIPRLGQVEFRYLVDFFEAERPDLPPDHYLALQVLARKAAGSALNARKLLLPDKKDRAYQEARKEYDKYEYNFLQQQGYLSAARIRPAHALSVHRAQGRHWPCVWLNATRSASSETPDNQDYFRWLYTASTCAVEHLVLHRLPPLSPLANAAISRAHNLEIAAIPIKQGLQYDKARQPTEQETALALPAGFTDIKLVPLLLELTDRLKGSDWTLMEWREHVYQVVLTLAHEQRSAKVQLKLHYDKTLSITNSSFIDGTDAEQVAIRKLLINPFVPQSDFLAEAVEAVRDPLEKAGFTLTAGKETDYRVQMTFAVTNEAVEVVLNANKEGMISSLRVIKATSEKVLGEFELALELPA